jgi:pyruvate/2-oxoglutarate dehydrogenase complex dihydrolipoamide dehydrogenase (E3) component
MEPAVLILGAGPAGISAAATLAEYGIEDVRLIEREPEAGGIPRLCPHPTFGVADYFRPMSGPAYAARLRSRIHPKRILRSTTATAIGDHLEVTLCSGRGEEVVRPKRLLLATGIREMPRAGRLVSGDRPRNVLTTGALQRILGSAHRLPFARPVIIGTELVAFSAVLSLRDAGVRAVAMIEPQSRIVARRPADTMTRIFLRTPVLVGRRLASINADPHDASRLASVTVARKGKPEDIACDAVIFTGAFVPEASLLGGRPGLCDPRSKGPAIDQFWELGRPGLYAAGNVLRSVETASWSAREGALAGHAIAADLMGKRTRPDRRIAIVSEPPVAFSTPSFLALPLGSERVRLGLRMASPARGCLTLAADGREFWRSPRWSLLPERRITIEPKFPPLHQIGEIRLGLATGP